MTNPRLAILIILAFSLGSCKEPAAQKIQQDLEQQKRLDSVSEYNRKVLEKMRADAVQKSLEEALPNMTAPKERRKGTIHLKNRIDKLPFPGPDVQMPRQAGNPEVEKLLQSWKSNGLYSSRSFLSYKRLQEYIVCFGEGFDFGPLDRVLNKTDIGSPTIIVENGNYSFEIRYYSVGRSYSVDSITVFTEEDSTFQGLRIGNSVESVIASLGEANFKASVNGEDWIVYFNKDNQDLGVRVEDGRVKYFQLAMNLFY